MGDLITMYFACLANQVLEFESVEAAMDRVPRIASELGTEVGINTNRSSLAPDGTYSTPSRT